MIMNTARASIENVDVSYKDMVEIARYIKYKSVEHAEQILKDVIEGKTFIPYRTYNKKLGHRKGGIKGRFPKKGAKIMLKLLRSCIANARQKGMTGNLRIINVAANKSRIYYRIQPKGKPYRHRYVLARAEIILGEYNEKQG